MAKKDLTPQQQYYEAEKEIKRAMKKRRKLERKNKWLYKHEIDALTATIASGIRKKEFAELQVKNPPPTPHSVDNSKRITVSSEVNVNSKNKKSASLGFQFGSKDKSNKSTQNTKKSKVKVWFIGIAFVFVLVAVIVITVRITNCVNSNKDNSSTTYSTVI